MASGRDAATDAALQDRDRASRFRFIGLTALGYAILSTAWIMFSDPLLTGLGDITAITGFASVKELAFVAVTTGMLVLALVFVPAPARSAPLVPSRLWPLAIVFIVVAAAIGVETRVSYQVMISALRSSALLAITSVATHKAEQVTHELGHQRDAVLTAAQDPALPKLVADWTAHPDGAAADALSAALEGMQARTSSRGVYLVAPDGHVLLGTGPPISGGPQLDAAIGGAALTDESALVDLHREPQAGLPDGELHFGYVVPIPLAGPPAPQRLALALFDFDPTRSVFQTLSRWPVPSRSGETLLVRDDGAGPILLMPPRDGRQEGFGRPLAVSDDVLTVSAPTPGWPWSVVAKLDTAEALGGMPRLLLLAGAGRMAVLVAAVAAFALLWQRLRLRTALAEVERGRQLLMAEARFRATFDQAAVGIAHIAPDGRLLRVNQRICSASGYSRDELIGRSVQDLVDPAQREQVLGRLHALSAGEIDAYTDDRRYLDARGRKIELSVTVSLVNDRAEPPYLLVVAQDIGGRKQAEAALRRLTEDLETRVREEVAARETAQARAAQAERLQALGQLAGGIAHDFNNVLQVVLGSGALITLRPTDGEAVSRYARIVVEAAERGASITRRLLAFGRRGDLRPEPLHTSTLFSDLREILVHTLGSGIDVQVKLGTDVPPLLADKGQLETALINLATNGRDAMPLGGRLVLSAEVETVSSGGAAHVAALAAGRYVRLTVADTGVGMDATTLGRSTEPFFTTKGIAVGTGLGLPMAKGFAEQSGGALSIDSSPGKGTAVTLWLPEAVSARYSDVQTLPGASDTAAPAATQAITTARVLLVDDENLVREIMAEYLQNAGFDVVVAENGSEALALLAAGEPVDVLVTDLSMPGMDGLAVIRGAQENSPGLPAVLLTGYAGDGAALAVSGAVRGSFSLLRKPVSGIHLVDRVRALLAEQTDAAE